MRHSIIFTLTLCIGFLGAKAQEKFSTKTGTIVFEASVPSFEEVKAKNESVSAIFNENTGDFASLALINAFRFKVALMEEHFNENYMESSKFPKAVFKGTLKDYYSEKLSATPQKIEMEGSITLHGVTKILLTEVLIHKKGNEVFVSSDFDLKPEDFNIEIPSVVSNKIAETINVSVHYILTKS